MKFTELLNKYEFHDCDVFTPFKIENDSITITFDLAKHLQFDNVKEKYKDYISKEDNYYIVKLRFLQCFNITAKEWDSIDNPKTKKTLQKNIKNVAIEQFDKDLELYSVTIKDQGPLYFVFSNYKKMGEIAFSCESVEVVDEFFANEEEYNSLWED